MNYLLLQKTSKDSKEAAIVGIYDSENATAAKLIAKGLPGRTHLYYCLFSEDELKSAGLTIIDADTPIISVKKEPVLPKHWWRPSNWRLWLLGREPQAA